MTVFGKERPGALDHELAGELDRGLDDELDRELAGELDGDLEIDVDLERALKALASPRRLQILDWLRDVAANFPPQDLGDPLEHGACNLFITDKLGVSQPAASRHMKVLLEAGLVVASPREGWVYYRRDEQALDRLKSRLAAL